MNLNLVFESIIPDNIKNIPVVRKCTEVLIEQLNRNSTIAQRISNIFSVDKVSFLKTDKYGNVTEVNDSEFLAETKNNLKNALFTVYLNVLYNLAQNIQTSSQIREATISRGYEDTLITKNIYDVLTSEYLGAFRYFQQNSGTKKAIKYIYQFAKYLETGYIYDDLDILEDGCFSMQYTGTLHKHYFSEFNQPMSHPCGWCYEYTTILELILKDYFGIEYIYIPTRIVLNGSNTIVFTNSTVQEFYNSLDKPFNFKSDEPLSQEEINEILETPLIRTSNIEDIRGVQNNIILFNVNFVKMKDNIIYFDNTILDFNNDIYYGSIDNLYNYNELYKFNGYVISLGDMKESWDFTYYDEFLMEYDVDLGTKSKYLENYFENAFKLESGDYPFTPGIDESIEEVTNYTINNLNSYDLSFDVYTNDLTYIKIYDDYEHEYIKSVYKNTELTLNTHGWYGNNIKFEFKNYNLNAFLNMNTLNKVDSKIKITSLSFRGNVVTIQGTSEIQGTYKVDGNTGVLDTEFNISETVSSDILNIELKCTNCNVKISTNLHKTSSFEISIPKYSVNITEPTTRMISINEMINYPETGKTLSELCEFEETFIDLGYKYITVKDDVYIVNSDTFTQEEFDCEEVLSGQFLIFDNSKDEETYTTNKFLTVYDNDKQRDEIRGMVGKILTFVNE